MFLQVLASHFILTDDHYQCQLALFKFDSSCFNMTKYGRECAAYCNKFACLFAHIMIKWGVTLEAFLSALVCLTIHAKSVTVIQLDLKYCCRYKLGIVNAGSRLS